MNIKDIIGLKLNKISVNADKTFLVLNLTHPTDGDTKVFGDVEGECCSESWIEHISLPVALPATITGVEDLDFPDLSTWDNPEYEFLQFYGFNIHTDKGSLTIDYRNDSNGYYGGQINWMA